MDSNLKFLSFLPRRLPISDSDSAVMTTTSHRSWTAIPVALAHLPLWHKRAWIVEPFDPEADPRNSVDETSLDTSDFGDQRAERNDDRGTWLLRRKEIIFGCQNDICLISQANGSSMVLLRKQKIYGADDYDWDAVAAQGEAMTSAG